MFNKLRKWLFPTTIDGFNFDAIDKDGDGIVQEGTPFERKLMKSVVKSSKSSNKKATAKKATAKKAATKKPATKKAPVKKPATKKPVKKTTKKKK